MKKNWNELWYNHGSKSKLLLRMKLLTFLLFLSVASMASTSYSQQTKFTMSLEQTTVEQVFQKIEESSEFIFLYSEKSVDLQRKVNISVENQNVNFILDQLFNGTDNYYEINDRQIAILSKKDVEASAKTIESNENPVELPQNKTISGKVTDSGGEPLPGVTVIVKGTTIGITTDFDGNYRLEVPADAEVLSFSFVGMKAQEITIGTQTQIDVVMESETIGLDEVVAIGYGIQKKSNLTGAIGTVQATDLENRASEDVAHSIQGKVAGVQVLATSGAPNSKASFRIRGYSSTGSSDPLYIVDGLKVSDISYLDQESIESIEILKDASSAAIYGAEAGNGVVLITTKKGKAGNNKIFYNMQYAVTSEANKMEMMNAQQFKEYWIESGRATEASFGTANTDWQDVIFDKGLMQNHTLGFQGNTEKGSLYLSMSYLDNNGMVTGDKDLNQRFTVQINADYEIKPWLTIGTTNSIERGFSSGVSENGFTGTGSAVAGAYYFDPTVPIVYENDSDAPGYLLQAEQDGYNVFRRNGKLYGSSLFLTSNLWNPLGMIDYVDDESWRSNVNGTIYGDFKPIKGLTVTSRLGYRIGNNYNSRYQYPYYWNPLQNVQNGSLSASNNHSFYYQWENYANYLRTIGKHDIAIMAGMQYAENHIESESGNTNLLVSEAENYRYLDYSSPNAQDDLGGNINENSNVSYFGRLSWTYDGRYTLQGSMRADAYDLSKLSTVNRWGYFPSFSASWTASNEQFMANVNPDILSSLKLRGSWGINGNISSLQNYPYATSLSLGGLYYSMTGNSGLIDGAYPSDILPNPKLSWEESRQLDIGLDARLFKDRLTIGADYYIKNTTDMLSTIDAPSISGTSRQTINAGKIKNSGFELDMSWRDRIGKLNYELDVNFSTIKNEVIESPYGETGRQAGGTNFFVPVTYFEAGYPIWYIRTYIHDHIDETTGLPVYKTAEELGTDDGKDYVGSAIPDFTYGITLSLEYEGIDLKIFGTGVEGNESFLSVYRPDVPQANLPKYLFTERWTSTNTGAKYPRANQSDGLYAQSDFWVHDASYFKIKQIQLGYNLPQKLLNPIKVSALRAFVSLENFFTFTKYPGNDPESMTTVDNSAYQEFFPGFGAGATIGVDRVSYPTMKSVVFGINLSF